MKWKLAATTSLVVMLLAAVSPVLADGVYLPDVSQVGDLAQSRQEVVMAIQKDASGQADRVTYVLQSRYRGTVTSFAWVIPVPDTPTDVVAHTDSSLFERLDNLTQPIFAFEGSSGSSSLGFGCAPPPVPGFGAVEADQLRGLVEVEASGQAGIFTWAALTSTGSDALLTWLNQNGYSISPSAAAVLDPYIQAQMHFLAVRVSDQSQAARAVNDEVAIPPIQFTCSTTRRFYPMAISQASAAETTEVLVYVIADHRAEAVNLPNVVITPDEVTEDTSSPSTTNYEALFDRRIQDNGGVALITEYAQTLSATPDYVFRRYSDYSFFAALPSAWPQAPTFVKQSQLVLTRLRTVLARDKMTFDLDLQDAASDTAVSSDFWVQRAESTGNSPTSGGGLFKLLLFMLFGGAQFALLRRLPQVVR